VRIMTRPRHDIPRVPLALPVSISSQSLCVFPSALGWMALVHSGGVVRQLTFGHPTAAAARAAVRAGFQPASGAHSRKFDRVLISRLQAYAEGRPDDFQDVAIALGELTAFRRSVLQRCRKIPYGQTLTYGQLAAEAGSPGAARAVGSCMAANRLPLLIPCHRVIPAHGWPGSYTAPGGCAMKRRILEMESRCG
jgi:methylated-DNA-[protein]-cysteine S-methyltransferase